MRLCLKLVMTLTEISNTAATKTSTTSNVISGVSKDASMTLNANDELKAMDPIASSNALVNSKKRTKASRACDQCRKKKIKCDYNESKSVCTNCQKSTDKCAFERVPLKRGPSKGYNKVYKNTKESENVGLSNNNMNSILSNSPVNITNITDNSYNMDPLQRNKSRQNSSESYDQLKHETLPASSVLLPPLSQYINKQNGATNNYLVQNNEKKSKPQENTNPILDNTLPTNTANTATTQLNLGQQQFWKVPYHEFPHQKRGSVDSLTSDLSARNTNNQENLIYNGLQQQFGNSNFQPHINKMSINSTNSSAVADHNNTNNLNNIINIGNDLSSKGTNNAYWSYLGYSSTNPNYQDMQSRRSSSIPSLLRQTTTSIMIGQPPFPQTTPTQPTYPYSQFHQQPIPDQRIPLTTSISSFGQYATAGFHTRNSSIVSEVMSPSAIRQENTETNNHQMHTITANKINRKSIEKLGPKSSLLTTDSKSNNDITATNEIRNSSVSSTEKSVTPVHTNNTISSTTPVNPVTSSPNEREKLQTIESKTSVLKRSNSLSIVRNRSNSVASINSIMDPIEPSKLDTSENTNKKNEEANTSDIKSDTNIENMTSLDSIKYSNLNNANISTMIYEQIPDKELINIYYEFIHEGFPIIPLNKETFTNCILVVNTKPLSLMHELNDYVIMWFRNSLELLVKLALDSNKKNSNFLFSRYDTQHDNDSSNQRTSTTSTGTDSQNKIDDSKPGEMFEVQTVFITALNECFQKIVDIHPKFRENKEQISPKIKVIYLSTFIVLNYILSYAGYDNSFVLGMSVTIFNEFKIYKLLLLENNLVSALEIEKDPLQVGCNIVFKRLYVLLIIFDSLQSCTFGGPKLLNIPIKNVTSIFFENGPNSSPQSNAYDDFNNKWCVDDDVTRMGHISQGLKLGEFITELSMSRKSINNLTLTKCSVGDLLWTPKTTISEEPQTVISILHLFHHLLIIKHRFINKLIALNPLQKFDLDTSFEIAEIFSNLIAYILQILTLTMRLNPTNSIDLKVHPTSKDGNMILRDISNQNDGDDASNFYQKLLGLNKDKTHDITNNSRRGIITPFAISIVYELHNIVSIIKRLPTKLIGLVMEIAHVDNGKAQKIVVSLSNSMNEMVQIMSLISMIKPFKIFDSNLNERVISTQNPDDLVMKWKFFNKGDISHTIDTCEQFINVGWRLMDDSELGWL